MESKSKKKKKEASTPSELEHITTKIKISGTITLMEPTETSSGVGLFLLEDGTVRWSIVTLNDGEEQ